MTFINRLILKMKDQRITFRLWRDTKHESCERSNRSGIFKCCRYGYKKTGFCAENRCGCYNLNPACPPSCGTAEEMKQRAFRYKNTLVLQTTLEDSRDPAQYKKDKLRHNIMTEKLAGKMEAEGITDILIMTAGPYKHNSCMSAYCVDAQKMADAAGMLCWENDGMLRYFSQILYS